MSDPLLAQLSSTPPSSDPARSLAASSSRATSNSAHPLHDSPPSPYPVYQSAKSAATSSAYSASSSSRTPLSTTPPTAISTRNPSTLSSPSARVSLTSETNLPTSSPSNASSTMSRAAARSISEAKEKLQTQNLKAELQEMGLGPESVGYAMVMKLAGMSSAGVSDGSWKSLMESIMCGKTTLLLPIERMASSTLLTPAFFLDHVMVSNDSTRSGSTLMSTLSGLRGAMDSERIVLSSCGTALQDSSFKVVQTGAITVEPDYSDYLLHLALCGAAMPPSSPPYPTFLATLQSTRLSIPRPSIRPYFTTTGENKRDPVPRATSTGSRLAALFSKSPIVATPASTPSSAYTLGAATPSSSSSAIGSDGHQDELLVSAPLIPSSRREVPNLLIQVRPIDKCVRRVDVVKAITKSLEYSLKESLRGVDGMEGEVAVVDKMCSFASRFQPPPTWTNSFPPSIDRRSSLSSSSSSSNSNSLGTSSSSNNDSFYTKDIESIADAMSDFFRQTRQDLARNMRASKARADRKRDRIDVTTFPERDSYEEDTMDLLEERIDASLELAEEALTSALYDRLFCPTLADDTRLDEHLSKKIELLNAMGLTLEQLGLDLGGSGASDGWNEGKTMRDCLEDLIGVAGTELARLQDPTVRSPRDKLSIFINLHKIVVDGLSLLPPVPLKECAASDTAAADGEEVEMGDTSLSKLRSRAASLSSVLEEAASTSIRGTNGDEEQEDKEEEDALQRTPKATRLDNTSHLLPTILLPLPAHKAPSTSSADLILPLLIYLIVQYDPPRLTSHLLFCQRFKYAMAGEASYCATGISAVIEYITEVDLAGFAASSTSSSTPSGGNRYSLSSPTTSLLSPLSPTSASSASSISSSSSRIREKVITNVALELDRIVDVANSNLVSAVDTSYRLLFDSAKSGLGFVGSIGTAAPRTLEEVRNVLDGAAGNVANRARGTILRRRSLTASANGTRKDRSAKGEREMIDIPPDGALPSATASSSSNFPSCPSSADPSSSSSPTAAQSRSRAASIARGEERPSIGDRLASLSSRFSGSSGSIAGSGAGDASAAIRSGSTSGSSTPSAEPILIHRSTSPLLTSSQLAAVPPPLPPRALPYRTPSSSRRTQLSLPQALPHFLEMEYADLKVEQVKELLLDYKRLGNELRVVSAENAAASDSIVAPADAMASNGFVVEE